VSEPRVNVDHFSHRPFYTVVGLLTQKAEIPAISADLASAGVDVAALLQRHGVHDVGYFGPGEFEQFTAADTD
jgi:hypothetical protein